MTVKIGQISTYDPTRETGGLETVVDELSTSLCATHEVAVFFMKENTRTRSNCRGYKQVPVTVPSPAELTYHLRLVTELLAADQPFDVLHAHGPTGVGPFLYGQLRSQRNITPPLVVTFHGTYAGARERFEVTEGWTNLDKNQNRLDRLIRLERLAAAVADIPVACSEAVKCELVEYYNVPASDVKIIHNGVDQTRFHPIPERDARDYLELDQDQRYLLWIGGDRHRKGLGRALDVIQSTSFQLLAVGDVSSEVASVDEVTDLGRVPEEQLPVLYNAADALVLPTWYEGHALSCLESLATQTPVLTTPHANVEIADVGAGYQYLQNLSRDEILSFVDKDHDFSYIDDYTWTKVTERYESLYRSLIKDSQP